MRNEFPFKSEYNLAELELFHKINSLKTEP